MSRASGMLHGDRIEHRLHEVADVGHLDAKVAGNGRRAGNLDARTTDGRQAFDRQAGAGGKAGRPDGDADGRARRDAIDGHLDASDLGHAEWMDVGAEEIQRTGERLADRRVDRRRRVGRRRIAAAAAPHGERQRDRETRPGLPAPHPAYRALPAHPALDDHCTASAGAAECVSWLDVPRTVTTYDPEGVTPARGAATPLPVSSTVCR